MRQGQRQELHRGQRQGLQRGSPPSNWVPQGPCPYELHRRFEEGKVKSCDTSKSCLEGNYRSCKYDPDPDGKIQQKMSELLEREAAQKADEDSEGEQESHFMKDRCWGTLRYHHPLDLGNVGGKAIVGIEEARTSGDESD